MGEARAHVSPPLVIKVGGSLAETGRLKAALQTICDAGCTAGRRVVVVAGGGAFADKVRDLQLAVGFDDAAAHRLAMLGQHQMAELFIGLEPRLVITDSLDGIETVLQAGKVPLWVPLPTLDRDTTIAADWSITSDGIAARLAELLGGAPLVLLKSVDVAPDEPAANLAEGGVVDAAFPGIVARAGLSWKIFGPSDDAALAAYLTATPGATVFS